MLCSRRWTVLLIKKKLQPGGRNGKREGGAVSVFVAVSRADCLRKVSAASAEPTLRGRFMAAPSHLSTRDGDSRGAAATAETRSPEISQVLRRVCALGESVRSIGAPSVHLRGGGRRENPKAVQQMKLSDDFEHRACMSDILASSERREKQSQECQSHLLEVLVLL